MKVITDTLPELLTIARDCEVRPEVPEGPRLLDTLMAHGLVASEEGL